MALSRLIGNRGACQRLWTTSKIWIQDVAPASTLSLKAVTASTSKPLQGETFEAKNKRLQRPISPHLTIYKQQSTTTFSIAHRATGLALTGLAYGLAASAVLLPGSFPHYLSVVESMHFGSGLIFAAKFLLAFPLTYHTGNGLRHLNWDLGNNFSIKGNAMSGYINLGVSLLAALYLASL